VTENSEVILKPVAVFSDPFRGGDNITVLCESWNWQEGSNFSEQTPLNTNFRHFANKIWDDPTVTAEKPWYRIEQEYTLIGTNTKFTM
jgi:glutamine synthetase